MKRNRRISVLLACLAGACLLSSQVNAAVSVVASKATALGGVGDWIAPTTTLTWNDASFQIPGGGSNGKLVVMIAGEGSTLSFSVTWNGTALTKVAGIDGGDPTDSGKAYVFTLDNPSPGTGPLIMTPSGAGSRYGVAALYATGVVGEMQFAVNGSGGVTQLSATTPRKVPAGSLVVSVSGHSNGPDGMTYDSGIQPYGSGAVQLLNTDGGLAGGSSAGADYLTSAPGGSNLAATWTTATAGAQNMGLALVAFGANPEPEITVEPASQTGWTGLNAQFSVTAVGAPTLSYQWYLGTPGGSHTALSDGGQISGATSNILTISNLVLGNNGTSYYVVITNDAAVVRSTVASLAVFPLTGMMSGSIASVPAPVDLTARGTLDWIAFDADGVDPNSIDRKAGVTPRISDVTLIDPAATKDNNNGLSALSWSDGTTTPVVALDPNCNYIGGGESNTCRITVPAGTQPKVLTVYAGAWSSDFAIQASLSDSSAPPFVAHYDGGSGADTMFPWRIAFAAGSDNQTLTVTMHCATKHTTDGGIELAGATLAGPAPIILTSPAANNTNWLGQTQTFSVTVEGIGPFTYQWYKGTPGGSHTALTDGGQISGATTAILSISNLVSGNAGSYYVVVTNSYNSATSGVANLTILGISGTISGFIDTHLPATVDLTAEGNLDWGHWGLMDETSVDVKATGSGSLNNWALYPDDTAGLADGPHWYNDAGVGYTWSDGSPNATSTRTTTGIYFGATDGRTHNGYTFTVPASTTPRVLRLYFGVYSCRAHVEASLSDLSAPTFVDESLAIHGDVSIEGVETVTFASASNNQTLTVKVYILEDYAFSELGWHGNVTLMSATLNVPAPHFTLQPVSATNWVGQSQQFSVVAVGGLPLTYQWYLGTPSGSHVALTNAGQFSGATSNVLTINNLALINATNYYAVVTSPYGSATSSAASLTIRPTTGILSGSAANTTGANIDLTAEGTLDWIKWGLDTGTDVNRKAGVALQISDFTIFGSSSPGFGGEPADQATFSWSDGTPTATASGSTFTVYNPGVGNGFQITVPADKTPKVFSLYAGGWGASIQCEAALSDNSAPPFVDRVQGNNTDFLLGSVHRITFAAGSPGQILTVTVFATEDTSGAGWGSANVLAATLKAAPATPNQPHLSIAPNGNQVLLSFPTQTGFTYTLQYKTALSDSTWQNITPAVPGDGTVKSVSQSLASPARFYRLSVQ